MKEEKICQVRIGDEVREYIAGTTYQQIADDFRDRYEEDIVLIYVDGKLQELRKKLKRDCTLAFETTRGAIGHETYKRSMKLLLVKSVYDVAAREDIRKVRVHFSIGKGYYCTIEGNISLNQEFLDFLNRSGFNTFGCHDAVLFAVQLMFVLYRFHIE